MTPAAMLLVQCKIIGVCVHLRKITLLGLLISRPVWTLKTHQHLSEQSYTWQSNNKWICFILCLHVSSIIGNHNYWQWSCMYTITCLKYTSAQWPQTVSACFIDYQESIILCLHVSSIIGNVTRFCIQNDKVLNTVSCMYTIYTWTTCISIDSLVSQPHKFKYETKAMNSKQPRSPRQWLEDR